VISLKKHMDSQLEELLRSSLEAYRAALAAIGKYGAQAYPQLGQDLQQSLLSLQEHLCADATPSMIQQTEQQVETHLSQWSTRTTEHLKLKTAEAKEIMLILARTAQSLSERDQRYAKRFNDLTTRFQAIACLEDLTEVRQALLQSAGDLRVSAKEMEQDGRQSVTALREQLSAYQTKLEEAEHLAFRDELTGLPNRREVERQLERRLGGGQTFCIMLFDLNGFKEINDGHGHLAGDQLLKQFASELRSSLWPANVIGRWGGDEFIAILDCGLISASSHLESARRWIFGEYKIEVGGQARKIRIDGAIGLAEWKAGDTIHDVLGRADAAMYQQKAPVRP
jgi:diguanylate cyclase (GGDEF)-like protein